jgi:hypothetical protein
MTRTTLVALALALTLPACSDITEPDSSAARTDAIAAPHAANAIMPGYEVNPPTELPPVQVKPTFWTCAGQAEGRFVDAVARIFVLETRALQEQDPFRQAVLFAEVARLKHEAKKALWFALEQCVATYGPPLIFALPDENGNLVFQRFSVGVYHAYLVAKHLEKPE